MLSILNYITWDVSPFIYEGDHFAIGWYGTLWTLGLIGMLVTLLVTFKHDGVPTQYAYISFMVTLICVIFFGHLFHGLFYEWYYVPDNPRHFLGMDWNYQNPFLEHPLMFLNIGMGGFASHGTVFGVLVAGPILEKMLQANRWYFIDRGIMGLFWVRITVRIGNLINSEIYGIETSLPWGFKFGDNSFISHPTQIYEILSYLLVIGLAWWLFLRRDGGRYKGLIAAAMTAVVMLLRIFIEMVKLPQMQIESTWLLNMGQLLSIPFAIWAVWFFFYAKENGVQDNLQPSIKISRAEQRRNKKK